MYKIYDTWVEYPDSSGFNTHNNYYDFKLTLSTDNLIFTREKINWYHRWKDQNGVLWLSAGHCNDHYILDFESVRFIIPKDYKTIYYQPSDNCNINQVKNWFFNQVIPMVMNHSGKEVLHASSILTSNEAIALVGNGGYGKSTIATSLIKEGYKLLSDDAVPLLLERGNVLTANGFNTMNLWPRAYKILLNEKIESQNKVQVVLSEKQHSIGKFPLKKIYFLRPSFNSKEITLKSISKQDSIIELTRAAHRLDITDFKMLQNQFCTLNKIVDLITCKILQYPATIPDPAKISSIIILEMKETLNVA